MNSRLTTSSVGQKLPWLVAALLVVMGSGVVAVWLNATAMQSDRDTLSRGADAIESNVEEQLRILELAGIGTRSLSGQEFDQLDVQALVRQINFTVLTSLLGVVSYPVDENGSRVGQFLSLGVVQLPNFEPPEIVLSREEIARLYDSQQLYFSEPFASAGSDLRNYVATLAVDVQDRGIQLVGVAFRPDRMLDLAVQAVGADQYAAEVVDPRYDNVVVAAIGEAARSLEEVRVPDSVPNAFELVVKPGPDFPFAQSWWIVVLVVATGVVIATLLVWMGRMAESRSKGLAESLRLAQELNESKDRFLATVSHELRTPLTVVLGVASEIGPRWDQFDDEERQDLMMMLAEQAVEAANIVEDLLVAARSDPSQLRLAMEQTHLRSHVEYAIGSLPDEGRRKVVHRAEDIPVYADTTRLRQILRNLLENAVRYGGDEITVDAGRDGAQVTVVVSDNGVKLSENDLERIFEPYEQTDDVAVQALSGVGIGLYVSRLLARLMGGELDCVRVDGWTKFRLRLSTGTDAVAADELLRESVG
jgi:signal transduction histidine kinase